VYTCSPSLKTLTPHSQAIMFHFFFVSRVNLFRSNAHASLACDHHRQLHARTVRAASIHHTFYPALIPAFHNVVYLARVVACPRIRFGVERSLGALFAATVFIVPLTHRWLHHSLFLKLRCHAEFSAEQHADARFVYARAAVGCARGAQCRSSRCRPEPRFPGRLRRRSAMRVAQPGSGGCGGGADGGDGADICSTLSPSSRPPTTTTTTTAELLSRSTTQIVSGPL
jgi:hypothetical protein